MEAVALRWCPAFPDPDILPDCAVPAARNVTQNAIEEKVASFIALLGSIFNADLPAILDIHVRIYRSIQICDHDGRRRYSGQLVNEQM